MRRYSILQGIPLSFFSRQLYQDVAKSWRGIGLVYLVVIVALVAASVLLRMQLGLNKWAGGPAQGFIGQTPTVVIRNRVVEVDRPMPYVMSDPATKTEVAIVDTTGRITSLDGLEARVLLTADQIQYRKSTAETRVFSLSGVKDLTISAPKAKRWLSLFAAWATPAVAPFVFGGLFALRLGQVVVFAAIGLLVARSMKAPLDFSALMRLTAVALTPALVLEPVLDLVSWKPPMLGMIWTLAALAYLVFAVHANRAEADVATVTDPMPQAPTDPPQG